MEVSESSGSFRFKWKVKNFSFLWHREHQYLKWTFNLKRNITTSWSLLFYPSTPKNCVSCFLRKESVEPLNFVIDYELSFLHQTESPVHCIKVSNADFNSKSKGVLLWVHRDDILENKTVPMTEDAISICCRIWTADISIPRMVTYYAETEIKVDRCTLTWDIVSFSGLKPRKKRDKFVLHPSTGGPCISFSLFLDHLNDFIFEIFVLTPKLLELCKCQVFLVDVSGKKLKCGRFEVVTIGKTTDPDWKFPLSLNKGNIMENKEQYLLNDTLTLMCEVAFASGIAAEPVQKLEPDCQNNQDIFYNAGISQSPKNLSKSLPNVNDNLQPSNPSSMNTKLVYYFGPEERAPSIDLKANTSFNSKNLKDNNLESAFSCVDPIQSSDISSTTAEFYSSPLSWKDDLIELYENGTFCDAELLVESARFPVHSLILSLRSPVFCDLFTLAKQTSIKIDELDADTVRKMILFLYTDIVENLDCECAKGLYIASNKYKILQLKDISSSFLQRNMTTIHCCDILLLADTYKDADLKQAAQNFIAEDNEVLDSDQWRSMEESHPRLTIETFRFMHLKLRKR